MSVHGVLSCSRGGPLRAWFLVMGLLVAAAPWPGCGDGWLEPDPGGLPAEEPIIRQFEARQGEQWVVTDSSARGAVIGVVGEHFGQDTAGLEVSYNGVRAEIVGLEDHPREGWSRIVTVVPEGATTGPVVVTRDNVPSQGVPFVVVVVTNVSVVRDIFVEETAGEGSGLRVWLGTQPGGVLSFDGNLDRLESGEFRRYLTSQGMRSNRVASVILDQAGRLIVGTDGAGLDILGPSGFVNLDTGDGLPGDRIVCVRLTGAGDLLVGTSNGMAVWQGYASQAAGVLTGEAPPPAWIPLLDRTRVEDFLELPGGRTLIAAYSGIWEASGPWEGVRIARVYPRTDEGPESIHVACLSLDGEGHVLAGTHYRGLLHFPRPGDYGHPERYPLEEESEYWITHIGLTPAGVSYVNASYGPGGLYRFAHEEQGASFRKVRSGNFSAVRAAPDGRVFAFAIGEGLYAFEEDGQGPENWRRSALLEPLPGNGILCLAPDGFGGLLVGTTSLPDEVGNLAGGLVRFGGGRARPVVDPAGRVGTRILEGYISDIVPLPGKRGVFVVSGSFGLGVLTCTADDAAFVPVPGGSSDLGAMGKALALRGGGVLLGALSEGLLFYGGERPAGPPVRLSRYTGFSFSAEDFRLNDFELLLPVPEISGGGWQRFRFSNVRVNTDFSLSPGGVMTRTGEEPAEVYAWMALRLDLEVSGVRFVDDEQHLVLLFKGTAEGVSETGLPVSLSLDEVLFDGDLKWILGGSGSYNLFDLDRFNMVLKGQTDAPVPSPPGLDPPPPLRMDLLSPASGLYYDIRPAGFPVPLPIRLAPLTGAFSVTLETFPVPEQDDSPTLLITSLQEDRDGGVWVGTQKDGLYRFRPEEPATRPQRFTRVQGLPDGISALAPDRSGRVFVGTFSDGLYVLEHSGEVAWDVRRAGEGDLLSDHVTALDRDEQDRLIVGMDQPGDVSRRGITVCETGASEPVGRCVSLTSEDGLIPARTQRILLDHDTLYLGTGEGLCVIPGYASLMESLFSPRSSAP